MTSRATRGDPRGRGVDAYVAAGLVLAGVVAVAVVPTKLTRPFWYDEVWRPHFVGEAADTFWAELAGANVPSALGWVGLTRLVGEVFGWHAAALRAPAALAVPLLALGCYLLARRFTGVVPAALAGLALAVSGTVVDLGTQLKPNTIEALVTVGILLLWIDGGPAAQLASRRTSGGGRVARRCAAGVLALFSVPAIFILVPLAAADVLLSAGRRARLLAAAQAAPALVIAGLHSVLFIAHQSAQRDGHFWDTHFLAGRDTGEAFRFVGAQMLAILSGAPPGVDGPDINLVHPITDGHPVSTWLIAPAMGVALVVGALRLARAPGGAAASNDPSTPTPTPTPGPGPGPTPGPEPSLPATLLEARQSRLTGGRLLLATLVGAEVLQLVASAWRYWPFGPVRTNLFVVPMIVVVAAVGADTLARHARSRIRRAKQAPIPDGDAGRGGGRLRTPVASARGRGATVITAVLVVVVAVVAVVPAAGASALHPLRGEQDQMRPLELLVDAAAVTRRLYRPGDLVVVGGRLARPGWLYAMELSEDEPFLDEPVSTDGRNVGGAEDAERAGDAGAAGGGSEAGSGTGDLPRVPREATVFLRAVGEAGAARAVAARPDEPGQVILFVLAYDRRGTGRELDAMRAAGWCESRRWTYELTGTLHSLTRCTSL